MKIIKYESKYRDDLIFMVLEAKNALNRVPTLNEDLLDIDEYYFNKGDMFWIMLDDNNRVIGSVGCNLLQNGKAVLHRLYVKADMKRQGIGTKLLETAEDLARKNGRTVMELHLGEKIYRVLHKCC
ncbi:MAG: GNAT family N-acetyltransferase [Ruminococcus sp.]|nr:GNAT family N-acetyltransferase [Ruminococcus sp.]MDY3895124.1 GNAT family N-acetyltransferase [Candidatus Fimenecus sp.]